MPKWLVRTILIVINAILTLALAGYLDNEYADIEEDTPPTAHAHKKVNNPAPIPTDSK